MSGLVRPGYKQMDPTGVEVNKYVQNENIQELRTI